MPACLPYPTQALLAWSTGFKNLISWLLQAAFSNLFHVVQRR